MGARVRVGVAVTPLELYFVCVPNLPMSMSQSQSRPLWRSCDHDDLRITVDDDDTEDGEDDDDDYE